MLYWLILTWEDNSIANVSRPLSESIRKILRVFNHNVREEKARRDPKTGNRAAVGCEHEAQEFPSPPGALVEGHMVGAHSNLSSICQPCPGLLTQTKCSGKGTESLVFTLLSLKPLWKVLLSPSTGCLP